MLVGPIMAVDATIIVRTLGHKNCSKTELTPSELITEKSSRQCNFLLYKLQ